MSIKEKIKLIPLLVHPNGDTIYKNNFEKFDKQEVFDLITLRNEIIHAKYSTTRDPNNINKSLWAKLTPLEENKNLKPRKQFYSIFANFLKRIFPEIKDR